MDWSLYILIKKGHTGAIGRKCPNMIATGVDIEPRELMASTVQRVEPSKDQLLEILTLLGYRTQGCRRVGASRGR